MTQRFERAYNALVKAFFEGTLAKGICAACAVGNIVGDAMGGTVSIAGYYCNCRNKEGDTIDNSFWSYLFCTADGDQRRDFYNTDETTINTKDRLLTLTGYEAEELARVEYAFETNSLIKYKKYDFYTEQEILEDQYNGLAAVVDVLCELDGMENATSYKQKFREHPQLN